MSSRLDSRATGLVLLLITSVGWGLNWPTIKLLLREWPPMFARGSAGLTAAIVIACVAAASGQRLAVPRGQRVRLGVAAFLNVFAWMGFSTVGLRWLTAGQGALLVYTMPVWATLLAWPLLGKRPSGTALAGLTLCISGVGLLFGGHDMALGWEKLPGVVLMLAAAVCFAWGTVAHKPTLPPLSLVAWQMALGCAPLVVLGLLFERPKLDGLSSQGWLAWSYMTVMPMGVCYLTWFAALRRLPPAAASIATLLTPVIGVTTAAWALGEPLGARELAAMGLVLGGIALALRKGGD